MHSSRIRTARTLLYGGRESPWQRPPPRTESQTGVKHYLAATLLWAVKISCTALCEGVHTAQRQTPTMGICLGVGLYSTVWRRSYCTETDTNNGYLSRCRVVQHCVKAFILHRDRHQQWVSVSVSGCTALCEGVHTAQRQTPTMGICLGVGLCRNKRWPPSPWQRPPPSPPDKGSLLDRQTPVKT